MKTEKLIDYKLILCYSGSAEKLRSTRIEPSAVNLKW